MRYETYFSIYKRGKITLQVFLLSFINCSESIPKAIYFHIIPSSISKETKLCSTKVRNKGVKLNILLKNAVTASTIKRNLEDTQTDRLNIRTTLALLY